MHYPYPLASIENMQPVRRHLSRGAVRGNISLNLLDGNDFRRHALSRPEIDITRALIGALFLPSGQKFTACEPSFTLARSTSEYPRLFTVSSHLNRGAPTSPELAIDAARYLTARVTEGVPNSNPLFLRVTNKSRLEFAAFLGGFVAQGAELVPLILLNGKRQKPPDGGMYPDIPFSQMNK